MYTITRYHDISCGHRVVGHESKCRHLHGHNYRIHFTCSTKELDSIGRVIDFSVVKHLLCYWIETNWDHKLLLWDTDPVGISLLEIDNLDIFQSIVRIPFNPTAENIAYYLVNVVGPEVFAHENVKLISCSVS